jgi:hypothetical protein
LSSADPERDQEHRGHSGDPAKCRTNVHSSFSAPLGLHENAATGAARGDKRTGRQRCIAAVASSVTSSQYLPHDRISRADTVTTPKRVQAITTRHRATELGAGSDVAGWSC